MLPLHCHTLVAQIGVRVRVFPLRSLLRVDEMVAVITPFALVVYSAY